MEDTRDIKITIVNESMSDLPADKGEDEASKQKEDLNNSKLSNGIFRKIAPSITSIYLINQSESLIKQTATYALNEYMSLTDNYVAQNNSSIAMSVMSRSTTILTSMIGAGATLGPVGLAVSAVIQGVTLGVDILKNYHNQTTSVRVSENNLNYQRVRAGYSLTAGSVGENK